MPNVAARPKTIFDLDLSELVETIAHRGDQGEEFRLSIDEIHQTMRGHYKKLIHNVGRNVFPLILARDDAEGREGTGGTYTLWLSHRESRSVSPVPPRYAMLKSLSHMPLGLFTILGPSFDNAHAYSWQSHLASYGGKVRYALASLEHADLPMDLTERCWDMLSITHRFVKDVLARSRVTVEEYSAYTARMLPLIKRNIDEAAKIQVEAVTKAMLAWKKELGPDLWRQAYVVIPTIWPVSRESPREQIFRRLMDPAEVENRLIIAEGVKGLEEAKTLLGRIVTDRLAGRLVFTIEGERNRALTTALSSPKDVVADAAKAAIEETFSACPFAARAA